MTCQAVRPAARRVRGESLRTSAGVVPASLARVMRLPSEKPRGNGIGRTSRFTSPNTLPTVVFARSRHTSPNTMVLSIIAFFKVMPTSAKLMPPRVVADAASRNREQVTAAAGDPVRQFSWDVRGSSLSGRVRSPRCRTRCPGVEVGPDAAPALDCAPSRLALGGRAEPDAHLLSK